MYIYQGEELGLFEVPNIPWDRLEDPTAHRTRGKYTEKGRDGCRVPLPWVAGDTPAPAKWNPAFGEGASFGFSPSHAKDGGPARDPHLPQPLWFKDFAVDKEESDETSMLSLYRKALSLRATLLTPTGNVKVTALTATEGRISYTREALVDSKPAKLTCLTNFSQTPASLPQGRTILVSDSLTDDGLLPQDTTAWVVDAMEE